MTELLKTLRIFDDDGRMSLTNVALMCVLFVILREGAPNIDAVLALAAALGNYSHKRQLKSKEPKAVEPVGAEPVKDPEIRELWDALNAIKLAVGFKTKR